MPAFFITFEGGEGAGKSTQASLLAERLRSQGFDVLVTREPGGTPGADAIRHIILSGAAEELGADVERLLFAAARADHVDAVILPALAAGHIVICDRFLDSTRVYQGAHSRVDREFSERLEGAVLGGLYPDLTIILDVPVKIGAHRAQERRGHANVDRFEKESSAVQEARRDAFRAIAQEEPDRCIVIDGSRAEAEVATEISNLVEDRLAAASMDAVGQAIKAQRPAS